MRSHKPVLLTIVMLIWASAGCSPAVQSPSVVSTLSATQDIPSTAAEQVEPIPNSGTTEPDRLPTSQQVAAGPGPQETQIETVPASDAAAQTESEFSGLPATDLEVQAYPVPGGSHPHDVAPAADGSVWYTAQAVGALGRLDPSTGETHHIPLGIGSAPHGVIVGPDGAPWITDSGLNAIVRVDPATEEVTVFPLSADSARTNLNTAVFDQQGVLWFTGQNGFYGRLDPANGQVETFPAPGGRGPYGIATTPNGDVYYVSLAGSYLARINPQTRQAEVLEPPTPDQGARRVWADSHGRLWISEWSGGQLGRYDPTSQTWQEWRLPGERPQPYSVYVDDQDIVWLSDFGANAIVRFDPQAEEFHTISLPRPSANVRQLLGRPGEVWGAESGTDHLIVIRTR